MDKDQSVKRTAAYIINDDSGATAIEYGLLLAVLALSMVFGLNAFTNQLYVLWHSVENHTNEAATHH
jgi:Flp pilus assembly pilin Flp